MTRQRPRFAAIAFAAVIAAGGIAGSSAVASAAGPARTWTLAPLARRTSDEVIARDIAAIEAWRAHLDSLDTVSRDTWRSTTARAWLEAALEEYTDHDETGFDRAAFERAREAIQAIEAGTPAATPERPMRWEPMAGSAHVRGDLWETLARLQRHPGYECAVEELARLQVSLARAGNEQIDQGDCHASPHIEAAERHAREARLKAEGCGSTPAPAPRVQQAVPVPKPTGTVPAPALEMPTAEELRIPRDVHFAVARFTISPSSQAVIEGVAAVLEKYPSIAVHLIGHTDSRGSAAYNLRLSQRRVRAVRTAMIALGIELERITHEYKGEGELVAGESDVRGLALNRRVEMLFVDSEGREIKAESQEGDLQIEE